MKSSVVSENNPSNPRRFLTSVKGIDKWIFEGIEKFIIAFGLLSLSIIVFGIVLTRYFLGYTPDWSDELPRFIVIWITFIGMSYCVRKGEHVVIDVLFNKLKGTFKKYFYVLMLIICFAFLAYMTYIGYKSTVKIFAANQRSVTLGISLGYVYMAVPIGCFLTAKNFLHILIKNLTRRDIYLNLNEGGDQ